jgi:hypothetical protein
MVALCGNCHPAQSKSGRDRQYEVKRSPFNIGKGILRGALEYDKRDLIFRIGGIWYENIPTIIRYRNVPIIACSLKDGQAMVSLNLFDALGNTVFSVVENQVSFRVDDLWDFEYAHNMVIARYAPRKIALCVDFRNADATIEGNIWAGSQLIKLGREETTLPGCGIRDTRMGGGCIGIQIGERAAVSNVGNRTRRNAPCPCGSTLRFKHCCGSIVRR